MVNAKLSVEAAINYEVDKNEEGKALGEFDQSQLPAGAVSFNGHYYYVYDLNTVTTWEEAKQYCKSQGGYLATVTSQEENEFVYSYLRNNFDYESAYFGLTDRKEEGNWVWDNGEISSYTNWHSGEPNSENPNEDFAMYYYKYSDGSWNDGDFGNKTVNNGRVFICEWGEYQMVANGQSQEPVRNTSDERDIVMVLDVSGSMSGEPMEETKKASSNFISTILQEDASIGIVTYDDSASMVSDFSVEESYLQSVAGSIDSGGSTNIEDGLRKAEEMLMSSNAKKKIIVLMSDGQPNVGMEGDELISYADTIKSNGTYIYTLGFFENMSGGKSDAQILMEEIASDGCHYEVANADDLRFFFGDIADQINGQKYIYVRIACPVDVNVTYGDETLSSAESDIVTRTSFGTLTFEENPNKSEDSTDDRIKILRLKDGTDYDIQIAGNGTGTMNYTIGFMDEVGEYSDLREFNDIEISNRTQIDTVAQNVSSTTLNVDSDGDGKYDLKYKAKANSVGEIVDYSYIRYIIYIAGILTLLLILYIQVKKWKRKSVEKAIKKKASQKRFCVHCGNMVSWDKKFCPKCGSKMENIN